MIDSPCHYCEFRHPACHDDCQVYADYAAKNYKNRHDSSGIGEFMAVMSKWKKRRQQLWQERAVERNKRRH